jgi:hypothetical protein
MRLFSDTTDMNGPAAEPEEFLVPEDTAEIGGELADVTVSPGMNNQGSRIVTDNSCFLIAAEFIA